MKKIKLSGFIVVRNEQKNIEKCLKSLDFCDEIIVVDQQSTDDTVKLAKKYTDKIYSDKCWGYADPSRKMAAEKCKGEWLLNLDADEEITQDLKKEILEVIKSDNIDAYYIHRNFFYLGKFLKYTGEDDWVLRLHKKDKVKYVPDIHVCAVPNGNIKTARMKNSMNHYPFHSMEQIVERTKRYAKIQAETDKKYNKFPRKYFGVFYTPIGYFIYLYIFKRGFLEGKAGLIYAYMNFYYQLLIYKNIWFKMKAK